MIEAAGGDVCSDEYIEHQRLVGRYRRVMKALVKSKSQPGLWLEDVDPPGIGINDVLIRVLRTGICGTDVHIYQWDEWAQQTIPVPMVVGHEFVGRIEAVGSNVADFFPGDMVSGEGHVVCGRCRNCFAGRRHLCAHSMGVGVNRPGAYAEYIALPMTNIWRHHDGIDLDVAAIFDPFGNAVHTALSFPVLGEDVLVTGAGPIGIMAAAVAKHAGARFVVIASGDNADPEPKVKGIMQQPLEGAPTGVNFNGCLKRSVVRGGQVCVTPAAMSHDQCIFTISGERGK